MPWNGLVLLQSLFPSSGGGWHVKGGPYNTNMNPKTRLIVAMFAPSLLICGVQADPPNPTAVDEALLRGPTVPDNIAQTLVNTDMGGKFIPIPGRPAEAALGLVLIDPERRQSAGEAAEARRMAIGMLLVDNIDMVKQASDATRAGENNKAQAVYRKLYAQFNPDNVRDPLLDALKDVLSEQEVRQIQQLVNEYWDASINWALRNAKDNSEAARKRAQRRLSFQLFRREIGEAYNWSLRPIQQRLESIYRATEPTEEQRSAIRDVMIDYIRESRLRPTPEQRQTAAARIYDLLDETQRLKLFEQALWQL